MTEYHAPGSLFDCLNQSVFGVDAMLRMSRSIVSGLAHLHMDIPGTQGNASYHQHLSRVCYCFAYPAVPCGLRGCKKRSAPFPGRMSYKATKPGSIFSLGLYFVCLYCFNLFVCPHPYVFPWAVKSSSLQFLALA